MPTEKRAAAGRAKAPGRVLVSARRIQARVAAMAREIGKRPPRESKPLVLLVILKGAYVFAADLSRRLSIPHELEFVRVQSYQGERRGALRMRHAPEPEKLRGRDVLVLDGIYDSGRTLRAVCRWAEGCGPARLRIAALLVKKKDGQLSVPVAYTGFRIPDVFVVGYGMDAAGAWRGLPDVRVYES